MTQFQPFLFSLALKILFILIKSKPEIEGMTVFDYNYLYSAYADGTVFFLKDIISVKYMVDTFLLFFWNFSRLKPNLTKSEIASIGFLDYTNNESIFEDAKCLSNQILLIFELYVYKSREKKLLNINNLIAEIQKIKRIEKEIALPNSKKTIAFTRKWHIINNIVP